MITLKDYQRRAVNELQAKLIELLNEPEDRQRLVFKAPTGSGKTVMTSALLDEVTQGLPYHGLCKYARVAWVWIAPNKLHQQSYRSMRNFFSETRNLRPVMFDECDHLSGLQPGDVLFLNWESINKDNAVLIRDNEQNRTLYELIRRTKVEQHVPVVVIIDEEHMFGGRNAKKSELVLQAIQPKVELRVSATPVTPCYNAVEVKRSQVVAEEMIKKGIELNPNVRGSKEQNELTVNQRLLVKALKKREELARAYREHDVNPLLLIQLPNDTSESLSADDRTITEEMRQYLETMCDISVDNGKLAIWTSKDKTPNLQNITRRNDLTEVLLFKQAIALGWDCPRASVLLIFRDLKSMTFTTQTVGRILRMPDQRFYSNELLNHGYVYTNLSADIIQVVGDDMNYISTVFSNRRHDLNNITLPSVYQDKNGPQRNRLGSTFRKVFYETLERFWELNPVMLFPVDMFLEDGDDETATPTTATEDSADKIAINRQNARKHGVVCDVSRIMVEIPKDTHITGADGQVEIVDKARIALNATELGSLFTQFCRQNVGSFAKHDSTPVLQGAIEAALDEYLGVFPTDAPKVVLYHQNRPVFEYIIRQALAEYEAQLAQTTPGAAKVYKETQWEVPTTRLYNSQVTHSTEGEVFNHALRPFFELNAVSKPEHDFARWIDRQNDVVDWWYKNGDEGKQHFAVPYTDSTGRERCFYVDFIIRLKSGTICLFDTKTPGSDVDAPEKNNALYQFCQQLTNQGKKVVGGVLINQPDTENWYFPEAIITNTDNTGGWTPLDFRNL